MMKRVSLPLILRLIWNASENRGYCALIALALSVPPVEAVHI